MAGLHLTHKRSKSISVPPGPHGHVYQIWYRRRPGSPSVLLPGQFSGPNPAGRRVAQYISKGRHGMFQMIPVGDDPNHPEFAYAFGPGKHMWGWFVYFG